MNNKHTFELEPYDPPSWLRGGHIQSVMGHFLKKGKGVSLKRARLNTPDGDFLDIDFASVASVPLGDDAPVVFILHGLEGSSQAAYAQLLLKTLAEQGIRAVCINYRSCSGVMNRTARFYHAGATDDVRFVHDILFKLYPNVPHGLVGISLGANMLLKYLGENDGERSKLPQVRAAVAISPFFDMNMSSGAFDEGGGRFYAQRLLRSLQSKAELNAHLLHEHVDVDRILNAKTVREFDEYGTARLHGFRDAADYYNKNSSGQFLADIDVATLLIRSLDDPFFEPADIPHETIANNPNLYPAFMETGGHVGFLAGINDFWAERQTARFLGQMLR
ncbi:MAG: YheT family hydrolase [Candidatus Promineifilaceae bacterium]